MVKTKLSVSGASSSAAFGPFRRVAIAVKNISSGMRVRISLAKRRSTPPAFGVPWPDPPLQAERGGARLHKVVEVLLGCMMRLCVSWVRSPVWPLPETNAGAA